MGDLTTMLTPREHKLAQALSRAMQNSERNSDRTMEWALRALRLQRACIEAVGLLDQGRTSRARQVLSEAAAEGIPNVRSD
jgi:cell division inhibitor SulA